MVISRSREGIEICWGKLTADKAAGVDELSPRMMLHFPDEILVSIYACCLRSR